MHSVEIILILGVTGSGWNVFVKTILLAWLFFM